MLGGEEAGKGEGSGRGLVEISTRSQPHYLDIWSRSRPDLEGGGGLVASGGGGGGRDLVEISTKSRPANPRDLVEISTIQPLDIYGNLEVNVFGIK